MASLSPKPISESASGASVDRHNQLAARQPDATPKTTVKRLTATEEILKAKGVNSLEELEVKHASNAGTKQEPSRKPDVKAQLMEVAGVKTLPELKKFTAKLREPTATEALLESQGVKTLAELAAKRAEERRAKHRVRTALWVLFLSIAFNVGAQDPKVYTLISGGTNAVPANSTNAAVVHRVDEYGAASLQASVAAPSGTSNLLFYVFRSVGNLREQPFYNSHCAVVIDYKRRFHKLQRGCRRIHQDRSRQYERGKLRHECHTENPVQSLQAKARILTP